MAKIEYIAVGERLDMIAEVSAWNPLLIDVNTRECKWLVMPVGDATWDTEWFSTKKEAIETAKILAAQAGVKVFYV